MDGPAAHPRNDHPPRPARCRDLRPSPQRYEPDLDDLLAQARSLVPTGRRAILGITGAPGAGKSTLAEALVTRLDGIAALVPMDGFHLPNRELERLGRRDRKGAPDTFDADAYVGLLRHLRNQVDEVVRAPVFRREIEEPAPDAIPIRRDVPLVVTEGNYLLVADGAWGSVRPLLDACWYIEGPEDERVRRLIARHVEFGKTPDEAHAWVHRSDEANARVIEATRARADLVVRWSPAGVGS